MDRQTIIQTLIQLGKGILEEQAQEPTEAPEADLLLADPKVLTTHTKPNRASRRASKPIPKDTK